MIRITHVTCARVPLCFMLIAAAAAIHAAERPAAEQRHPVLAEAGRGDERLLKQFTDKEWMEVLKVE
jgi:hypothetical protein